MTGVRQRCKIDRGCDAASGNGKNARSITGRFRDPIWLHGILQEEARAGWTMVEKFDDTRVRLKRPARARTNDATLGFDPYRTWVGMSQWRYTGLILA